MNANIRRLLHSLVAAFAVVSLGAQAQSPSAKPIRIVAPFAAGGGTDTVARTIAQKMSERGRPMMVDNRPSAGGIVAAEIVAKAAPDGYTLFVGDSGHFAINPNLYKDLSYDPVRDFAPVIEAVDTHLGLTVRGDFPAATLAEFIAQSKSRPKGLLYGSPGNGSPHHLAMELLRSLSNAKLVHVPYKGSAQAAPALLAGDIDALFAGPSSTMSLVKAGRLKILVLASQKRAHFLPNVPTIVESGYPDYEIHNTIGLLAPIGTSPEFIRSLNAAIIQVLQLPETTARLTDIGMEALGGTPEEFGRSIRRQIEQYARLVKISGAKQE